MAGADRDDEREAIASEAGGVTLSAMMAAVLAERGEDESDVPAELWGSPLDRNLEAECHRLRGEEPPPDYLDISDLARRVVQDLPVQPGLFNHPWNPDGFCNPYSGADGGEPSESSTITVGLQASRSLDPGPMTWTPHLPCLDHTVRRRCWWMRDRLRCYSPRRRRYDASPAMPDAERDASSDARTADAELARDAVGAPADLAADIQDELLERGRAQAAELLEADDRARPRQQFQSPRVRICGRLPAGAGVEIAADGDARCTYRGVARCGLVWECPVCQATVRAHRAQELEHLVEWWGRERCAMLTITVRHHRQDDLRSLARGVSDAYRALTRGEAWRRFRAAVGLRGSVRALEITHGPNGWHPHLHVLLLLDASWRDERSARAVADWRSQARPGDQPSLRIAPRIPMRIGRGRTARTVRISADRWLRYRWQDVVERHMGAAARPDTGPGVMLTDCDHDGRYLAKMGCEVSDPGSKRGRTHEHRSHLQIAADLARSHHPRDRELWREFVLAIRGRKQLTWSRGLKAAAGIPDLSDEQVASHEDPGIRLVPVLRIGADQWSAMCWLHWAPEDAPAPVVLLQAAEQHGAAWAADLLRDMVAEGRRIIRQRSRRNARGNPPRGP